MASAVSDSMWKTSAQPAWCRIRAQGRAIPSLTRNLLETEGATNPPRRWPQTSARPPALQRRLAPRTCVTGCFALQHRWWFSGEDGLRAASVSDFRELARRRLPHIFFEYIDGGSYAEVTLRRNVADLEAIALRQRVMRDMSNLDMSVTSLGQSFSMPVGLAPV